MMASQPWLPSKRMASQPRLPQEINVNVMAGHFSLCVWHSND